MGAIVSRAQLHADGWSWRDIAAAEVAGRVRKVHWGWYEHVDVGSQPAGRRPAAVTGTERSEGSRASEPAAVGVLGAQPPAKVTERTTQQQFTSALADLLFVGGPGARVAGAAAAYLRGLDGFDSIAPQPLVEVPVACRSRHAGLRRVSSTMRPPIEIAGLATADPEDTLLSLGADLAPRPGCAASRASLSADELVELAVEDALRQGLTTVARLERTIAMVGSRRRGRAVLRAVLARRPAGAPPTESYLETRAVQVLRNGRMPSPRRQVELHDDGGRFVARVDLLLGRVVIECDGYRTHHRPIDQRLDRQRMNRIHALGYVTVAFTFDQIEHHPRSVVETVTRLHAAGSGRPRRSSAH